MLTLHNGPLRAQLLPASGGRIAALSHERLGDILVPMDEGAFDPEFWPKAGAYPLIPFHNRIRGGRFSWDGRDYQLPHHPSEPNALHGFSNRRAWSTRDVSQTSAIMELEHAGDDAWPWPLFAEQRLSLEPQAIAIQLSVTNRADTSMPAGLGWHPYFKKAISIEDDAKLSWPIGPDLMPLGASSTTLATGDTRYLSDWRQVRLDLPDGARLSMTADPLLSHLVIHDVAPGYSCVEPTSHLANALGTTPPGVSDRLRSLAPGQTLAARFRLEIR